LIFPFSRRDTTKASTCSLVTGPTRGAGTLLRVSRADEPPGAGADESASHEASPQWHAQARPLVGRVRRHGAGWLDWSIAAIR
jgi:hypothetical protein